MNNVETIKKNMGDLYAESKGDSFKHKGTDGENMRVNALEYYLLNATEEHGVPEVGEKLVKAMGSGEENPFDDSTLYTPTGGYLMGNLGKSYGLASTMTGAAGLMTGGAAATTGAMLTAAAGPLALAALVGSVWKGANDAAAANRKKMKELGDGLKSLNRKRTQMGEDAREDIANIWEGVGSKRRYR